MFKIKKSFKLLSCILSSTLLASFTNTSTFAAGPSGASKKTTSATGSSKPKDARNPKKTSSGTKRDGYHRRYTHRYSDSESDGDSDGESDGDSDDESDSDSYSDSEESSEEYQQYVKKYTQIFQRYKQAFDKCNQTLVEQGQVLEEYVAIIDEYRVFVDECIHSVGINNTSTENRAQCFERYNQLIENCKQEIQKYKQILQKQMQVLSKYEQNAYPDSKHQLHTLEESVMRNKSVLDQKELRLDQHRQNLFELYVKNLTKRSQTTLHQIEDKSEKRHDDPVHSSEYDYNQSTEHYTCQSGEREIDHTSQHLEQERQPDTDHASQEPAQHTGYDFPQDIQRDLDRIAQKFEQERQPDIDYASQYQIQYGEYDSSQGIQHDLDHTKQDFEQKRKPDTDKASQDSDQYSESDSDYDSEDELDMREYTVEQREQDLRDREYYVKKREKDLIKREQDLIKRKQDLAERERLIMEREHAIDQFQFSIDNSENALVQSLIEATIPKKRAETEYTLQTKIENAKRSLENYNLSIRDYVYLKMVLESIRSGIMNYCSNIGPMDIDEATKYSMYREYIDKKINERLNNFRKNNPEFQVDVERLSGAKELCLDVFTYIFSTANYWATKRLDPSIDYANQIILNYLQNFANIVCRAGYFSVGMLYMHTLHGVEVVFVNE